MICLKNCGGNQLHRCHYIYIIGQKITTVYQGNITNSTDHPDIDSFINYIKGLNFVECEFLPELKAQVL